MRRRARSTLAATLGAAGLVAGLVLGATPASADPDPNLNPGDPAVVDAPPPPDAPPPLDAPPPPRRAAASRGPVGSPASPDPAHRRHRRPRR